MIGILIAYTLGLATAVGVYLFVRKDLTNRLLDRVIEERELVETGNGLRQGAHVFGPFQGWVTEPNAPAVTTSPSLFESGHLESTEA